MEEDERIRKEGRKQQDDVQRTNSENGDKITSLFTSILFFVTPDLKPLPSQDIQQFFSHPFLHIPVSLSPSSSLFSLPASLSLPRTLTLFLFFFSPALALFLSAQRYRAQQSVVQDSVTADRSISTSWQFHLAGELLTLLFFFCRTPKSFKQNAVASYFL